ncbi:MAG: glycosyltransferase, partial [Selenomonadaceae bacterium]|nr:glycosyltransferase [Selenomonadaceae bacterium]
MINKKEQRFFAELAISSPPQRVNFVKPRSLVRTSRALVPNVPIIIPKNNVDKSLIHVCFALYDGTKTYSRFTGTAILSLFENTKSKVMIHLLHDNTLTEDNREKLMQIVERYGQQLKFYNVEELCADGLVKIEEQFPKVKASNFSIATFYRFFIPDLLLPQGIEKAIYLDSDIVVNLDIAEFWQIELGDKPLGVVPEIDNGVPVKEVALFVTEGVIAEEIYFNAGILLMNLKVLHNEEAKLAAGTKFVSEYPRIVCFDQDVLNYCFAASALKLPIRFNFYVLHARRRREFNVDKKLCHYAAGKWSFIMDTNDPFYQLFMKYFIKTPWVDSDTAAILLGKGLPSRKYHAVSVVIPMYNAEKYINECLDSLLIQTFQDFEVIVVDDCSTDDSVKIVKEYAPKFHGRLKLEKTEKNSGGGGHVPRNMGMLLARGDYLYFMDADDMILSTALETFYMAAILYDAEVVYSSSWYFLRAPNDIYLNKDGVNSKMRGIQTEFVMDDPNKNLSRLLLEGSSTAPLTKLASSGNDLAAWTKFVRRDFILRNKIFFANIPTSGDAIRTINMYCHARRFLRISTPLYIHRIYNDNSITRMARTPQEQCKFWFSSFMNFAKVLYELEKENKFLAENPFYGLAALSIHLIRTFKLTEDSRRELGNEELYKVLHSSFSQGFPNSSTLLLMFLFSILSDKESNVRYLELINNKFSLYFTAKIYVRINKKMNEETIQILSLSDKKARISKPKWWQKEGTCHIIDSYKGELDIVAKAIVEGNVQIRLGGPFVLNPEDKSKRIPYWIDFTKLIVNDKLILDTSTPTWNNKPYVYNITDVKAGEEIKFHIEWLPHRSDAIESQFIAPPPKLEPKVVTPAPPEVKNPIPRNFMPFITARMEVKLMSKEGDFQILSVSDSNARITKPEYLQKGSTCYCIHTTTGKIKMITKS